jgi:integrase/recombinase XerD
LSRRPVTRLGPAVADYLALKTALGRQFASERRALELFVEHVGSAALQVTSRDISSWHQSLQHVSSNTRAYRVRIIRNFCLHWRRTRPGVTVPDRSLIPRLQPYVEPYIFEANEVARLVARAARLPRDPRAPLRPEVFRLAFILLYCSGLRRGELLRLVIGDYDVDERTILIRVSKFHKSRILPLSPDAAGALDDYLRARRQRGLPIDASTPFAWNGYGGGRAYTGTGFATRFRALLRTEGIRKADGRLPRVHDLRHTFAVHALLRWYRAGDNVQGRLPYLSAYMGHVSIVSTERYLPYVSALANAAGALFAAHAGALIAGVPESAK